MSVFDVTVIGYRPNIAKEDDECFDKGRLSFEPMKTYQDMVDGLLISHDVPVDSRHFQIARRAVISATRDIPHKHQWAFLKRRIKVNTYPAFEGVDASYKMMGGAVPFQVTLNDLSQPLPRDAHDWTVQLGFNQYEAWRRIGDYELQLKPNNNPGQDIDQIAWNLFQQQYPLPSNFVRIDTQVVEVANAFYLEYLNPADGLDIMVGNYAPQRPYHYTVRSDGERYGRMILEFFPPPVDFRTYDAIIEVKPRRLLTYLYKEGTVTGAANTCEVTFSSDAVMHDRYDGCIIRFGTETMLPEGPYGNVLEGTLFFHEAVIEAVDTRNNTARISPPLPEDLTNVRYTISDPIDIWPVSTLTYFEALCDTNFSRFTNRRDVSQKQSVELQLLREAMGSDRPLRGMYNSYASNVRYYDLEDWALPGKFGGPGGGGPV